MAFSALHGVAPHGVSCMALAFAGPGLHRHVATEGQKEIVACRCPAAHTMKPRPPRVTSVRQVTHPHPLLKEGNRGLASRLKWCHFHRKKELKNRKTRMCRTRTSARTHAHTRVHTHSRFSISLTAVSPVTTSDTEVANTEPSLLRETVSLPHVFIQRLARKLVLSTFLFKGN